MLSVQNSCTTRSWANISVMKKKKKRKTETKHCTNPQRYTWQFTAKYISVSNSLNYIAYFQVRNIFQITE